MTRLIDADALDYALGSSDEDIYCRYTLEEAPTVDAIPVSFIESEIKRMGLEIDIAMSEANDETAERWIIRKSTLEFTLEKWRAERREE